MKQQNKTHSKFKKPFHKKPYDPVEVKTVFYEENGIKLSHAVDHKKGWSGYGLQLPNAKTEVFLDIEKVFAITNPISSRSGLGGKDLIDAGKARRAYATFKERALPGSTYISFFIQLAKAAKDKKKA